MIDKKTIKKAFTLLNKHLKEKSLKGEVLLCGGAVMCLVFNARESTRDVDAIFEPTKELKQAAEKVAEELNLPMDWLNDGAKGFFSPNYDRIELYIDSNLSVYAPTAEYMLAMKCISARYDSQDKQDVIFLINKLDLKKSAEVFNIIEKYYPKQIIPVKTQFFVEEIIESKS